MAPWPLSVVAPELMRWMNLPAASPSGLPSRDTLHSLRTPVGADVGEHHALVGDEVTKEHGHTPLRESFSWPARWLRGYRSSRRKYTSATREVEVGLVVGPLSLSPEYRQRWRCGPGPPPLVVHLEELLVAVHEIVDYHHVLFHSELPVAVLSPRASGLCPCR